MYVGMCVCVCVCVCVYVCDVCGMFGVHSVWVKDMGLVGVVVVMRCGSGVYGVCRRGAGVCVCVWKRVGVWCVE